MSTTGHELKSQTSPFTLLADIGRVERFLENQIDRLYLQTCTRLRASRCLPVVVLISSHLRGAANISGFRESLGLRAGGAMRGCRESRFWVVLQMAMLPAPQQLRPLPRIRWMSLCDHRGWVGEWQWDHGGVGAEWLWYSCCKVLESVREGARSDWGFSLPPSDPPCHESHRIGSLAATNNADVSFHLAFYSPPTIDRPAGAFPHPSVSHQKELKRGDGR